MSEPTSKPKTPTTRKRVTSKPEPVSETVTPELGSIPQHNDVVAPDHEPKFGKAGGKVRTFTLLDPPTRASQDAPVLYSLYEVNKDGNNILIDQTFTSEELQDFIEQNGQWLA